MKSLTHVITAGSLAGLFVFCFCGSGFASMRRSMQDGSANGSGTLDIVDPHGAVIGECPLKHTAVQASVSGPVARVTVTQEFKNNEAQPIEAVYTFPLPHDAAVDAMTLHIGERTVKGLIKKRDDARKLYEQARDRGHLASLLDQERPNIFTQSIANLQPNETVNIEISYVQIVPFADASYELRVPTVVGPRYIPGRPTGYQGGGWAQDTDQVPDASRITPPIAREGTRAGHDLSLSVELDAGVTLGDIRSSTHPVSIKRTSAHQASVNLVDQKTVPNKDFVLLYEVAGQTVADAVMTHTDNRGGFATLLLTPPERPAPSAITPKELVFVLDTSGSMMGFPIEKAKEAMHAAINALNPNDTFNLITFAGSTELLFPAPVPATSANLLRANEFLLSRHGSGGTEMMNAIRAALQPSDSAGHLRVVCFMTDGYVGNENQILNEIRKHANARVFAFGIGTAVNHFLLDRMAAYGRGEVDYVGLQDDGSAAARRFHERVQSPILTDISIDWGGLDVSEVYPKQIPDLFSAKPVWVAARFGKSGTGVIRLTGKQAGHPFTREIPISLPSQSSKQDELATLWARQKVKDLMAADRSEMSTGEPSKNVEAQITQTGLDFRLMTQFTSFVAIEERTNNPYGSPRRVDVPVEMPEGVSQQGGVIAGVIGVGTALSYMPGGFVSQKASPPIPTPIVQPAAIARHRSPEYNVSHVISVRLHLTLADIVTRLNAGQRLTAEEDKLIGHGMVRITVQVANEKAIALLAAAGFRDASIGAHGLERKGEVAVQKLAALAQVPGVVFITPRM